MARCGRWWSGVAVGGLWLAGCASAPPMTLPPAPWAASEPQNTEPPMQAPDLGGPSWSRIGTSVRGKAIEAATVGTGTRRIYVIGGMQGDEPESREIAARLPEALASLTELNAATVRVVRDMNPDGSASGRRQNNRGVDLNRNWPSSDFRKDARSNPRPKSELETAVVYEDMKRFKPDVVVVLRSSARGPEVTFDGPALQTARHFTSAARQHEPRWRMIPQARHRVPGSLESLVGRDWKKPVVTAELARRGQTDPNVRAVRDGVMAIASAAGGPAAKTATVRPTAGGSASGAARGTASGLGAAGRP